MGWGADAVFLGLTAEGQDVIDNLRLNKNPALHVRKMALRIQALFANRPGDAVVEELYLDAFGFPEELPDLQGMRPPGGNALPEGVKDCYFEQWKCGTLPPSY